MDRALEKKGVLESVNTLNIVKTHEVLLQKLDRILIQVK